MKKALIMIKIEKTENFSSNNRSIVVRKKSERNVLSLGIYIAVVRNHVFVIVIIII